MSSLRYLIKKENKIKHYFYHTAACQEVAHISFIITYNIALKRTKRAKVEAEVEAEMEMEMEIIWT